VVSGHVRIGQISVPAQMLQNRTKPHSVLSFVLLRVYLSVLYFSHCRSSLIVSGTFCFSSTFQSWLFLLGCQYQCKWLAGKTRPWNDL